MPPEGPMAWPMVGLSQALRCERVREEEGRKGQGVGWSAHWGHDRGCGAERSGFGKRPRGHSDLG